LGPCHGIGAGREFHVTLLSEMLLRCTAAVLTTVYRTIFHPFSTRTDWHAVCAIALPNSY
jgi:hypothetical protein